MTRAKTRNGRTRKSKAQKQFQQDWRHTLGGIRMLAHALAAITERAPVACRQVTAQWLDSVARHYRAAVRIEQ